MLTASVYFPAGISGMPLFNRVGILLPQGLGIEISTMLIPVHPPGFSIMLLTKTDDNWTPPEEIVSISPNQGEQGTTLTDIQLTCIDTTFEDDGVSKILFFIPDGLTVSNINVISNTEIEFDLEIANDAPVGERQIYVVYTDSTQYVQNSDIVFEVLEKTN